MDEMYGYILHMESDDECSATSLAVKGAEDSWQAEEKGIDYFYAQGESWHCVGIIYCETEKDFNFWIPSCYDTINLTEE